MCYNIISKYGGTIMDDLTSKTVKELLAIAKEYRIAGRHDMKKQQLIDAIVEFEKILIHFVLAFF